MNEMDRQAIRTTFDGRLHICDVTKFYFKPLVKKLKNLTLVAKSDLRFKVR